jgi:hypothetical protein
MWNWRQDQGFRLSRHVDSSMALKEAVTKKVVM